MKKKYLSGISELSNNIQLSESNQFQLANDFSDYVTDFDYSQVSNTNDKDSLFQHEVSIHKNINVIKKSSAELCSRLYEAQEILSSYDKNHGMFLKWFESLGLEKTFVYRCIFRYKLFLEFQKDIFLSDKVSLRILNEFKKINDPEIRLSIANKIESNELCTPKDISSYLVAHVQLDNLKVQRKNENIIKIYNNKNKLQININYDFSHEDIVAIEEMLQRFIKEKNKV